MEVRTTRAWRHQDYWRRRDVIIIHLQIVTETLSIQMSPPYTLPSRSTSS